MTIRKISAVSALALLFISISFIKFHASLNGTKALAINNQDNANHSNITKVNGVSGLQTPIVGTEAKPSQDQSISSSGNSGINSSQGQESSNRSTGTQSSQSNSANKQEQSSRQDLSSQIKSSVSLSIPQVIAETVPPPAEKPAKLLIPTANVDTTVIQVGITSAGNLDVPPNFVQVGWYKYGTIPGQVGSAVLDGHVDNGGSVDGVFKHLRDVKVGDEITIVTEKGSIVKFRVTESNVYQTKQFPSEQIFSGNGEQRLIKIITCHGNWVPSEKTYDQRLVVTAVLE